MDRSLTPDEEAAFAGRLASVGFVFLPAGIGNESVGFDVRALDGSVSYGCRYQFGESAVDLMERICAERGC